MALSQTRTTLFLAIIASLLTLLQAAAIPNINPYVEEELESLKHQRLLSSEASLENVLKSPQEASDVSEQASRDVVNNNEDLDEIHNADEDTEDEKEDEIANDDDHPEEELHGKYETIHKSSLKANSENNALDQDEENVQADESPEDELEGLRAGSESESSPSEASLEKDGEGSKSSLIETIPGDNDLEDSEMIREEDPAEEELEELGTIENSDRKSEETVLSDDGHQENEINTENNEDELGHTEEQEDQDKGTNTENNEDKLGHIEEEEDQDKGINTKNNEDDLGHTEEQEDQDKGIKTENNEDDLGHTEEEEDQDKGINTENNEYDLGHTEEEDQDKGINTENNEDELEDTEEQELFESVEQEDALTNLADETDSEQDSEEKNEVEETDSDLQEQAIEDEVLHSSENTFPQGEEYEGFGEDNGEDDDDNRTDDFIEITDASKFDNGIKIPNGDKFQEKQAQNPATNEEFSDVLPPPFSKLDELARDDALENDAIHADVKRGDKFMKLPGHAPLRVIELNETVYLNNTDDENVPKFRPVPIPRRFEDYDVNADGLISLPEMRYVTGAVEGAKQAFRDADRDGDGWVERGEFDIAAWGVALDTSPTPTPHPQRRVVFVPHEELHPSSIPRGKDDVSSRRHSRRH